ncbi:hypothetical protein [Lysinibacillus xylanilyticus]|uniref:hypothetical protein n=1 Tax=Lysinibacillus xylanilyticus TaxID=582475 RepID=UPI00382A2E14
MSATESMRLTCGSSSLIFDGITDIQGQVITMEGSNKAPGTVSNTSGEGADLESALGSALGSLPVVEKVKKAAKSVKKKIKRPKRN